MFIALCVVLGWLIGRQIDKKVDFSEWFHKDRINRRTGMSRRAARQLALQMLFQIDMAVIP
jgi:hypothetical protein